MEKYKIYLSYLMSLVLISTIMLISCKRNFDRIAKEENKYELTTEVNLKDSSYSQKIEDFYDSGKEGFFNGEADVQIYYRIFEQPDTEKAILISSGRTEAAIKYKELIFDLAKNGYAIYILDHRGQGLSGRMTENPDMGYIDNFQFYIDDMKYFYDHYLKPENYKNSYLLAHSMGGAIGITYLEQHPNDFTAAAFSSPMLGLTPSICSIVEALVGDTPEFALGESKLRLRGIP
ncbi:alpha/beta fold hydrolase [uncultured Eudoraea sp.]|uniref:alpha/beta fold hydrolase n=1 Tax=uncultured Eudoraea sp. TaxID=1035614 RepID=UPI0026372C34|nr:alpha/beta fold hydrolase [uncultured Eudoraea sp.]